MVELLLMNMNERHVEMNSDLKKDKIRILFGILSVDVHTRASIVITSALRNAGMEVIYLGFRLTPKMIASIAEQESPDVICLSTHQGFHTQLFPTLVEELKNKNIDIPIVAGGNIQEKDKIMLERIGITGNFGPGTPIDLIINHIKQRAIEKNI
jgi:methylmalonyl-CoA mutase, C-terminal domain